MRTADEVLDEIRALKGIKSDAALGKLFGVKQSTVASWRSRNSLPYADVIAFCHKENFPPETIFIECKHTNPVATDSRGPSVGEPDIGYSVLSDLEEMLLRIIKEGDETKLAAIRGVLSVYDPGNKG